MTGEQIENRADEIAHLLARFYDIREIIIAKTRREESMALVVFLRGVNVGGHKTFQPSVLAKDLAEYDVVNVGAAGTFVVRKPISQAKLRAELLRRLPFEPQIMICSGHDVIDLVSMDPFAGGPAGPDIVRFMSVLAKRPQVPPGIPISLPAGDDWLVKIIAVRGRFAFGL
jgi:hypothetical protein